MPQAPPGLYRGHLGILTMIDQGDSHGGDPQETIRHLEQQAEKDKEEGEHFWLLANETGFPQMTVGQRFLVNEPFIILFGALVPLLFASAFCSNLCTESCNNTLTVAVTIVVTCLKSLRRVGG